MPAQQAQALFIDIKSGVESAGVCWSPELESRVRKEQQQQQQQQQVHTGHLPQGLIVIVNLISTCSITRMYIKVLWILIIYNVTKNYLVLYSEGTSVNT